MISGRIVYNFLNNFRNYNSKTTFVKMRRVFHKKKVFRNKFCLLYKCLRAAMYDYSLGYNVTHNLQIVGVQ